MSLIALDEIFACLRVIAMVAAYLMVLYELSSIANSLRSIKISMASAIEECDDDDE